MGRDGGGKSNAKLNKNIHSKSGFSTTVPLKEKLKSVTTTVKSNYVRCIWRSRINKTILAETYYNKGSKTTLLRMSTLTGTGPKGDIKQHTSNMLGKPVTKETTSPIEIQNIFGIKLNDGSYYLRPTKLSTLEVYNCVKILQVYFPGPSYVQFCDGSSRMECIFSSKNEERDFFTYIRIKPTLQEVFARYCSWFRNGFKFMNYLIEIRYVPPVFKSAISFYIEKQIHSVNNCLQFTTAFACQAIELAILDKPHVKLEVSE